MLAFLRKSENTEANILCAAAFLLLPVAAMASMHLWVLALAAAIAVAIVRAGVRGPWPSPRLLIIIAAAFIGWGTLSALWSIDPARSLSTALRIALVAAALVVLLDAAQCLMPAQRRRFGWWLAAGAITGLVLIAGLIFVSGALAVWFGDASATGHELDRLNRTSAIVAILVWPVALVVAQRHGRYAAASVIVLATAALIILAPTTPLVAFLLGAGAFLVAWISQRVGRGLLVVTFIVPLAAIPFMSDLVPTINEYLVANMTWPNSEVHRFVIWEFAAQRILEHPIVGWGLDSARAIPGGDEQVLLFTTEAGQHLSGPLLPLHTHNALIQVWLETGIVGLILFSGLFLLILRSLPTSRTNRAAPATAIATLMTALAIAQLSFGIWQGWWMATLGLMAVMVTGLVDSDSTRVRSEPATGASAYARHCPSDCRGRATP